MTWAIVDVDVSRYLGKTEKVNVTLPSRLIHWSIRSPVLKLAIKAAVVI